MANFPGIDSIGYGINLLDFTPFDITSTDRRVVRGLRILPFDSINLRDEIIEGTTYRVPRDVAINQDSRSVRGEYISFPDGKDAAGRFRTQVDLQYRFFAASGPPSAMAASEKTFLEDSQYAFFTFSRASYIVRRMDYYDALAERQLLIALKDVPKPFDPSDEEAIENYKIFFRTYGSHVVHAIHYGSRYPLSAWASNEDSTVNNRFNTFVEVKFNGIPSGGRFDPNIRDEPAYKQFDEYLQRLVTVSGGGDEAALKVAELSATYADYQAWINTIDENKSALLSFEINDLWTLLRFAESAELRSYAGPLNDAFIYLVGNLEVYETHVSLDIQSDWAEFNLLTPSAVIIPDANDPYPDDGNTVASRTRVQWGKENSHEYDRKTLRFFVVNDGSKIDFSTSHGSYAGPSETGKAIVTIEGENYLNDVVTDDIWNTHWFYKAPVSSQPVARRSTTRKKAFNNWSDTLRDYLAERCESG